MYVYTPNFSTHSNYGVYLYLGALNNLPDHPIIDTEFQLKPIGGFLELKGTFWFTTFAKRNFEPDVFQSSQKFRNICYQNTNGAVVGVTSKIDSYKP